MPITNVVIWCEAMSQKISFPEWVERVENTGRSKAAIADELQVELASLYRYLSRDRIPNKKVMDRIHKASGGLVDIAWFYAPKEVAA